MGIFKNIWNSIFGKSKKQEEFGRGGSIEEPKLKVAHKKTTNLGKIGGYTSADIEPDKSKICHYQEPNNFCKPNLVSSNHGVCTLAVTPETSCSISTHAENEFEEPNPQVCNEVQKRIAPIDTQTNFEVSEPTIKRASKKPTKNFVMSKEQEVLQYLLKYGSIDKITCNEKFGLKRLDNVICELRKQGMNIKNETVELHNELGEKVKVNNYRLVSSNESN